MNAVQIPQLADWSDWYLTDEDDVGEGELQWLIINLLGGCLQQLAKERGWEEIQVRGDQFFAWMEAEPLVRISPDLYTIRRPDISAVGSWQTWRPGHPPPIWALEVVSQDWRKDYHQIPPKYAMLGVQELFVFDPDWRHRPRGVGVAFRVYRRDADGDLHCVHEGEGGYWSEQLSIFVVAVGDADRVRLRLAHDIDGRSLVPTAWEVQDAARVEIARQEAEIARGNAEIARLRALLAAKGGQEDDT